MKPLRKSETVRFEKLCEEIRRVLHMEHWEHKYHYTDDDDKDAGCMCLGHHGRVEIMVCPSFWELTYEEQRRVLLHEHIHAIMQPITQMVLTLIARLPEPRREPYEDMLAAIEEPIVYHLQSVLV